MAAPKASFVFTANGLSVQFTDRSSGNVTSWLWDFGDTQTSSDQNPPAHLYAQAGIYKVKLAASNADGTDIFQFDIVVSATPTIALTIFEMVQASTPPGIAVDGIVFQESIHKWMLYLQEGQQIPDADVFDESKWPPLVRVLIAKLIIYDLVINAASGAMIVFANASQTYNQLAAQVTSGSVMVADYTCVLAVGYTYPITINLIIINGVSFGPSSSLADDNALINYLNGLNKGTFILDNGGASLKSLGNPNIITTFNYTHGGGGVNSSFTQTNARIVNVTQQTSSGSTSTGQKGPIKRIEAGPSVAEWYDSSTFWSNMFKSSGGALVSGQSGGVVGQIQADACVFANRLGISLPFCPELKRVKVFQLVKKPC